MKPACRIEWRHDAVDERDSAAAGLTPSAEVYPWLVTRASDGSEQAVRITHEQAAALEGPL